MVAGISVVPVVFIVLIVEVIVVGFYFPDKTGYVVLDAMTSWIGSVNASEGVYSLLSSVQASEGEAGVAIGVVIGAAISVAALVAILGSGDVGAAIAVTCQMSSRHPKSMPVSLRVPSDYFSNYLVRTRTDGIYSTLWGGV